jgi:site-specific DNA-methyltransferase (adenine-specific)
MPDLRDVGKKSKEAIGIDKLSFGQVSNADRKESNYIAPQDSGSASRYFYCAKASKKDRDEGLPDKWLDSLEIILYNDIGDELWKDKITTKEENKVKHLEDMEVSLQKVIEEYGTQTKKDIDLNMLLHGKKSLEKYLKENKYTTKTEINSTTISQILNLLTPYTTKENIQDVKLETENGINHVEIVENINQLEIIIKENQGLVHGANNVVLKMLLKINEKEGRNEHCTVKPTELMQYLIRLVTPNNGTILDPFNGSGSTGKAVMYENKEKDKNYKYIGIELSEEYLNISKARIDYVVSKLKPKSEQVEVEEIKPKKSWYK